MLAIDHMVIASRNPEKDAQKFVEEHGVIVIEGGRHEAWGTFNFLAYFKNNSYIEWIGVFDEDLAKESENPLIRQTVSFLEHEESGLISYALRTTRMDEYIRYYEAKRIDYQGPFAGSRKKGDGSTLSWRMLFPDSETNLPFLIEWGTEENLPLDETKINPKNITTIQVPQNPKDYDKFLKLKSDDYTIELDNGKIIFTPETGFQFNINDG